MVERTNKMKKLWKSPSEFSTYSEWKKQPFLEGETFSGSRWCNDSEGNTSFASTDTDQYFQNVKLREEFIKLNK